MVTFDCHSNIVYSDIEGCAFKPMAKLGFRNQQIKSYNRSLIGCLLAFDQQDIFEKIEYRKKESA